MPADASHPLKRGDLVFSQGGRVFLPRPDHTGSSLLSHAANRDVQLPEWLRAEIHQAGVLLSALADPRCVMKAIQGEGADGAVSEADLAYNRDELVGWIDAVIARLSAAKGEILSEAVSTGSEQTR